MPAYVVSMMSVHDVATYRKPRGIASATSQFGERVRTGNR